MNILTLNKYHPHNTFLYTLLSRNQFHCANREQLNDPFDLCDMIITRSFLEKFFSYNLDSLVNHEVVWYEMIKTQYLGYQYDEMMNLNTEGKVFHILGSPYSRRLFISTLVDSMNYKVTSFCGADHFKNELLMWGHYAKYDGVRLTFEFDGVSGTHIYDKIEIDKVNYFGPRIEITSNNIKESLKQKRAQWAYEDEYRIITRQNQFIKFPKKCLKIIDFGFNMDLTARNGIITMCRNAGYTCDFRQMLITDDYHHYSELDESVISSIVKGDLIARDGVGYTPDPETGIIDTRI